MFWNTLDRSTSEPLGGLLLQFHGKTWQRKDANNDDAPLIVKRYAPRTEGASVVPYWPELAKEVNGMPGLSTSLQKRIDESPMDISGLKWICHQQLLDSMRAQLQTTARCSPEQAFAICSAAIMSYNYAQQSRTPVGALLRHEDEWTGPELAALKGTPFGLHRHMAQQYIRRMISELDKAKRKQLCHERLSITKQALEIEHFERTKADEPDMHLVSAQAIFAGLLDSQAANYQRVLEQAEELDRCIDLANLRPEQVQPFEEMYQVVMQGQWKKR